MEVMNITTYLQTYDHETYLFIPYAGDRLFVVTPRKNNGKNKSKNT